MGKFINVFGQWVHPHIFIDEGPKGCILSFNQHGHPEKFFKGKTASEVAEEYNAAIDRRNVKKDEKYWSFCENCRGEIGKLNPKYGIHCMDKSFCSARIYTDADADEARHLIGQQVEFWRGEWKEGELIDVYDESRQNFVIDEREYRYSFIREIVK